MEHYSHTHTGAATKEQRDSNRIPAAAKANTFQTRSEPLKQAAKVHPAKKYFLEKAHRRRWAACNCNAADLRIEAARLSGTLPTAHHRLSSRPLVLVETSMTPKPHKPPWDKLTPQQPQHQPSAHRIQHSVPAQHAQCVAAHPQGTHKSGTCPVS